MMSPSELLDLTEKMKALGVSEFKFGELSVKFGETQAPGGWVIPASVTPTGPVFSDQTLIQAAVQSSGYSDEDLFLSAPR